MRLTSWKKEEHGSLVQRWWESRQGIDFSLDLLPELGAVAYDEGRPVAMAFLFTTNSKVAWIGWPISDPEAGKEVRSSALNEVLTDLHGLAEVLGFSRIWTTSGIPALQKRFEELGYKVGDVGINQYFKELE